MTYTPGPWHVGMKPGPMIYGPKGQQVVDMREEMVPADEHFANARFIAKAPEMLEALRDAIPMLAEHVQYDSPDDDESAEANILRRARAILASIEGE